jgi:hypothetical protein
MCGHLSTMSIYYTFKVRVPDTRDRLLCGLSDHVIICSDLVPFLAQAPSFYKHEIKKLDFCSIVTSLLNDLFISKD